jgi:hypothetical protein
MQYNNLRRVALILLLLTLTGCSSNDRMPVQGAITLDGKPLENGAISFRPAPGSMGHSAGGKIVNGEFRLPANHGLKPGKYLVAIQSFMLTGRMIMDPQTNQKVPEQILLKYNEAGKLEAVVVAGDDNHFDFRLTSAGVGKR